MALSLVQQRQALLDEIERRDPAGFADLVLRAGRHSTGSVLE